MTRAIFIASTSAAAHYWAHQWGYLLSEVLVVRPTDRYSLEGIEPDPEVPCFICEPTVYGSDEVRMVDLVDELQIRGFMIFDAQEMGGEYRPVLP